MATNRELRARATELATELGIKLDEDVERMNRESLDQLVKKLEEAVTPTEGTSATLEDADASDQDDGDASSEVDDDAASNASPPTPVRPVRAQRYEVASRRSLPTRHGIRRAGQEVTAASFTNGQRTLDDLVRRGILVKC